MPPVLAAGPAIAAGISGGGLAAGIGSAAGGLASGLLGSKAAGGVGGGGGPPVLPFSGGGVNLRFKNGIPTLTTSGDREAAVNALQASLLQQGGDIRGIFAPQIDSAFGQGIQGIQGLLDQIKPGFGALTESRLNTLKTRGASQKSDLRANLARRRVLGSSFAEDLQSRQEQQLSQDIADSKAKSFLEELDASNQLMTQRTQLSIDQANSALQVANQAFGAEQAASQVEIDEQNTLLQTITQLISGATSQIGANSRFEQGLQAQSAAGAGAFFAPIAKAGGGLFGDFVGGLA